MTFIIDIDNTLFRSKCVNIKKDEWVIYDVDKGLISDINKAYKKGHEIIVWTGRRWEIRDLTEKQLKKYGVKYHALVMGKPVGIYVDKEAVGNLKGLI